MYKGVCVGLFPEEHRRFTVLVALMRLTAVQMLSRPEIRREQKMLSVGLLRGYGERQGTHRADRPD